MHRLTTNESLHDLLLIISLKGVVPMQISLRGIDEKVQTNPTHECTD